MAGVIVVVGEALVDLVVGALGSAVRAAHQAAAAVVVRRRAADPPHGDELPPDWAG